MGLDDVACIILSCMYQYLLGLRQMLRLQASALCGSAAAPLRPPRRWLGAAPLPAVVGASP